MKDIPDDWFDLDSSDNYTFLFSFEAGLNRRRWHIWVQRNWSISIWASIAYLFLVLIGQRLMLYKRTPFPLRVPLFMWNALLAVYSITGFVRTSPEFYRVLTRHGFVHSVCQSTFAQDVVYDFWLFAFVWSKFVELFDTAFIILRKRPLTFLHCYHHVTVLIYCWHGGKELTAAGRWFCWMNYGVHSAMYTYYAVRATGTRVPRPVSACVTSLQLLQMLVGCCIVFTVYKTKQAAWLKGVDADLACHQSWDNLYFSCFLYFSYFLLFLRFFFHAYVLRSAAVASPNMAKKCHNRIIDDAPTKGVPNVDAGMILADHRPQPRGRYPADEMVQFKGGTQMRSRRRKHASDDGEVHILNGVVNSNTVQMRAYPTVQ